MKQAVETAKGQMQFAKQRLEKALSNVPDDRLNWSPSPTARSPLQVAAHAAYAVTNIQSQMSGTPYHYPKTGEADDHFREMEQGFTSREQVTEYLNECCDGYVAWLDALTPDRWAGEWQLPFGLGTMPVSMALDIPAMHMEGHTAQIEYIQTIYGDRDWHL